MTPTLNPPQTLAEAGRIELLPCPFCGSERIDPEYWRSSDRHGPGCRRCAATADTAQIWNTRAFAAALSEGSPSKAGEDAEALNDTCELCGGTGEIEARTLRDDRDLIGCPACMERDHAALTPRLGSAAESDRDLVEAISAFVPERESWQDDHPDDGKLHLYRGGRTFGDLRKALAARDALLARLAAHRPAPVAVPGELAELSRKATQGEWKADYFSVADPDDGSSTVECDGVRAPEQRVADANMANSKLIATAVNFVRHLIATQPAGQDGAAPDSHRAQSNPVEYGGQGAGDNQGGQDGAATLDAAREVIPAELLEIIDRFPELNTANYDHDGVEELNAWGIEVYQAAESLAALTQGQAGGAVAKLLPGDRKIVEHFRAAATDLRQSQTRQLCFAMLELVGRITAAPQPAGETREGGR